MKRFAYVWLIAVWVAAGIGLTVLPFAVGWWVWWHNGCSLIPGFFLWLISTGVLQLILYWLMAGAAIPAVWYLDKRSVLDG